MSDVVDRVKKLLRLKANAGSEAEAALAATRAAELMTQHEIHEADLRLSEDGNLQAASIEPISVEVEVTQTRKRVAWQMNLVEAVANTHHCYAYWTGGRVVLFGRLSQCQAASYVSQYLIREVNELAKAEAEARGIKFKLDNRGTSRAWYNAFKIGASHRIAVRLNEQLGNQRADEVIDEAFASANTPPASAGVMVIVQRDRKEVDDAYEDYKKEHFKGYGYSVGRVSNGGAYAAGVKAGGRVALGNNSRGDLPRGNDSLPRGAGESK